jgi:hypothetical protein
VIRKLSLFILLNLLITNPSKANLDLGINWNILEGNAKITNVEWSIIKTIDVTVYDPSINDLTMANCTAFYIPEDNKPIGGGKAYYEAGISQVTIRVPSSYKKKDIKNFKIDCENRK